MVIIVYDVYSECGEYGDIAYLCTIGLSSDAKMSLVVEFQARKVKETSQRMHGSWI
jgi:hypothetical protein